MKQQYDVQNLKVTARSHKNQHILASACAAVINYPLWRASAMGQSGFTLHATALEGSVAGVIASRIPASMQFYAYAFAPPFKGMFAVISGMTWARATIFWGSEVGKEELISRYGNSSSYIPDSFFTLAPPLVVSTLVQCVNQPIVRASITLQNPQLNFPNTRSAMKHIYQNHGLLGLWHGTSAGILKTVPKYCSAILVKDYMERVLPQPSPNSETYKRDKLMRSALKSTVAGIAGATLTNPLDVIRNEMFKTNKSLVECISHLTTEYNGYKWMARGMGKNLVAVSVPVGFTIFFTDMFIQLSSSK